MRSNEKAVPILILLVWSFSLLGIACYVGCLVDNSWRVDSVNQHHAEFYLDQHHDRQWRWLPAATQPEKEPSHAPMG